MPNTAQPAGVSRTALGDERPPQSYAIVPKGRQEPVLFKTLRLMPDRAGVADGWQTSVTGQQVFGSHKLAVEAGIATLPPGWQEAAEEAARQPEVTQPVNTAKDPNWRETVSRPEHTQTPDGKCGRETKAHTPCKSPAGTNTDHLGVGACANHEGQPLLEVANA
jgi:hypothetical protein